MTDQSSGPDLDAIEARAAEATPGPWQIDRHAWSPWVHAGELSNRVDIFKCGGRPDAEFVAHAREDIPALVAEVRRLRATVAHAGVRVCYGDCGSPPGAGCAAADRMRERDAARDSAKSFHESWVRTINEKGDAMQERDAARLDADHLRARIGDALGIIELTWEATEVGPTVRGLTTLEDVVACNRRDMVEARGDARALMARAVDERDAAKRHGDECALALEKAEGRAHALSQLVDDFKSASMLVGGSGDPSDITPCHVEQHIHDLRAKEDRLAEVEAQAAAMREALRPVLWAFALRMEAALKRNDWKGGWSKDNPSVLYRRLCEESAELATAISQGTGGNDCVAEEAADVGNFAMMLADLSGRLEPLAPDAGKALLVELAALREVAEAARQYRRDLIGWPVDDALAKLDALRGGK